MRRWLLTAVTFTSLIVLPSVSDAGNPTFAPEELLVGFHAGLSDTDQEHVYKQLGGTKIEKLRALSVHRVRVPVTALDAVARKLQRHPAVKFVERNEILAPNAAPNDPYFPDEWHLAKIMAPDAWGLTVGRPDVIIALLDSGIDGTHPDLAAKMVAGYNMYDGNTNTADVYGHGTKVAGAAAAITDNAEGVAGVARANGIMPIRVTDTAGYAYFSSLANGLTWAVDHGARVMSISFAGIAGSSTITSAAQYVVSKGGVVVAAAGNCGCLDSTAENAYILSVSATDATDTIASWSSRGPYVDLSAPGVGIMTTTVGGGYGSVSGTSFSAPITAGVAALVLSANPGLTATAVKQLLTANADDLGDPGWDQNYGFGRVNAYRAVAAAGASIAAPAPDTTAPTVSISTPASGATVTGMVTVAADAQDNVGVARVVLYVDGGRFAEDTTSPYGFAWDTTGLSGSHVLQAVAYDSAGNSTSSATVGVNVSPAASIDTTAPTVAITTPTAGATVIGAVSVAATAQDNVGVTNVVFYVDNAAVAQSSAAPYAFTWDTTALSGSHVLKAVAYDAAGNAGVSSIVTVNVGSNAATPGMTDTSAPVVSITGLSRNGINLSVTVSATDNVGVTNVELYVDGNRVGTATTAPYTFRLKVQQFSAGTHTVTAKGYDAAGNTGASASTTFNR
jgi:thermitase